MIRRYAFACAVALLFTVLLLFVMTRLIAPVDDDPMVGKFVWHDLMTDDQAAAKRFYAGLFGWTYEDTTRFGDEPYTLIISDGLYVGDMVLDVESGARAGVPVVLVQGGSSAPEQLRATGQPTLRSLSGLPDLLRAP